MPTWPEAEKTKAPEGHYSFRVTREAEIKTFTDSAGKKNFRIILAVQACGLEGTYFVTDSFVPWEPRYADLKAALGIEHASGNTEVLGKVFEGDIKHEADKTDRTKSYARISNIVIPADPNQGTLPDESSGDDVPF
jgi:hypothetical protein